MSTLALRSRGTPVLVAVLSALGLTAAPRIARAQAPVAQPEGPAPHPLTAGVIRAAVARHHPAAVRGGLGARPVVWVLADRENRVLRTTTGRDGLRRDAAGRETLDWEAAAAKLPGMPPAARPGDRLQWERLPAGRDTVDVAWVRVYAGLPNR